MSVSQLRLPMAEAAIKLEGLVKDFPVGIRGKQLRALDGLSLEVEANQIYGLLGPNGSGKSTTIKLLLGLLRPSSGAGWVFGKPLGSLAARQDLGYLPEVPYFYRYLTGRELLVYYARVSGVSRKSRAEQVASVLEQVGLSAAADRRVGTYSKGMLQRIGIAQALVHDPRLLIFDEPTAGVDPEGTAAIGALIRDLKAKGKTILISSHLLAQVEGLCDRIAIINQGRLLREGAVEDLLTEEGADWLMVKGLDTTGLMQVKAGIEAAGGQLQGSKRAHRGLEELFAQAIKGEREGSQKLEEAE
jgi:ABC-2 type transport system ATP-binding protein